MRSDSRVVLSEPDCWALLAGQSLGRLGLSIRAMPAILPVQYYLDGDNIAVCLGQHEIPKEAIANTVVAFSADSMDTPPSQGWSVHVLGRVRPQWPTRAPIDCGQPAAGPVVHLQPAVVSGQTLQLCPLLAGGYSRIGGQ
jgi:hypothetical protein